MKCKRWLSGLVAAAMLSTMTAGLPAVSAAETLPQPDYLFTFEQVADQVVESSGSTIAAAFLEGSAQVSYDADVPLQTAAPMCCGFRRQQRQFQSAAARGHFLPCQRHRRGDPHHVGEAQHFFHRLHEAL